MDASMYARSHDLDYVRTAYAKGVMVGTLCQDMTSEMR